MIDRVLPWTKTMKENVLFIEKNLCSVVISRLMNSRLSFNHRKSESNENKSFIQ